MVRSSNGKYDVGNKTARRQLSKKIDGLYFLAESLPSETKAMLDEVGKAGKEEMQRIIRESVSPWGEFRLAMGLGGRGPGREDTGAMHDSVSYATEQAASRISVRIGWINNFQDYFGFQEKGFKNWYTLGGFFRGEPWFRRRQSPVDQEGIHAFRDARMFSVQMLSQKVDEFMSKYKRMLK